MVIIDLMTSLLGVRMGFLAFLLIGGASGVSAWIFFPRRSKGSNSKGLMMAAFLGFLAASASAYLGQYMGYFQSGQMLEWVSAIVASSVIGGFYSALAK
jgi:uncharacterized membrane protein YeaQ/YmgE (transglycosylase-associated protein family)